MAYSYSSFISNSCIFVFSGISHFIKLFVLIAATIVQALIIWNSEVFTTYDILYDDEK